MLLPGTERILYPEGVAQAAMQGVGSWLQWLAPFVGYVPDHPRAAAAMVAIAFIGAIGAALFIAIRAPAARGGSRDDHAPMFPPAIALGAAIFALAALVQSPTVAYSKIAAPSGRGFDGEAFFAARFYYVALIGLVVAVAGIVDALRVSMNATSADQARVRAARRNPTTAAENVGDTNDHRMNRSRASLPAIAAMVALVAITLLAGYWTWQGRLQQALWAGEAAGLNRTIAQAAAAAVATLAPRAPRSAPCRIYLVDTTLVAPRFWPFSDTIVKAAVDAPTARALSSCVISTERTPWYHVRRSTGREDRSAPGMAPFHEICVFGKTFPSLHFDSVVFDYLAYPRNGAKLTLAPEDHVLRYDAVRARFDDITGAVERGEATVALRWSRPDSNACPSDAGTS
jgi:hypothetical protein